MITNLRMIKT